MCADYHSESESTLKKKKKGWKKLKSAFGGSSKKKRRRKKGEDGDSRSYDSYSQSSAGDADVLLNPDGSVNTAAQQEWINGGGDGLADMAGMRGSSQKRVNSAGGRGVSLSKIVEEDGEDLMSSEFQATRRGTKKRGAAPSSGGSSVASSQKSRKGSTQADPLSLVVLLVEPTSLRFELLSLDFDLTPPKDMVAAKKSSGWKKKRKGSSNNNSSSDDIALTVQDVLDQITPSALTDEKLKQKVATPGACKGLIDRHGKIHFGSASLEIACAKRPVRACDRALAENSSNNSNEGASNEYFRRGTHGGKRGSVLGVPSYSGEPHRDVMLGFFGTKLQTNRTEDTLAAVAKTLELARPIFADPNVIGLMENSGYDLRGWKPSEAAAAEAAVLGKPPKGRPGPAKASPVRTAAKTLVGLALVLLLAFVVYASTVGDAGSLPQTLEGYAGLAIETARSWYAEHAATAPTTTKRFGK